MIKSVRLSRSEDIEKYIILLQEDYNYYGNLRESYDFSVRPGSKITVSTYNSVDYGFILPEVAAK
jgi:hypothetical protein